MHYSESLHNNFIKTLDAPYGTVITIAPNSQYKVFITEKLNIFPKVKRATKCSDWYEPCGLMRQYPFY